MRTCGSILIVEDEEDIRDTLREILEDEGYHVFTAANGQEALEKLADLARPCVMLLDMMMPVMNGWELLQTLQDDVVLCTIPVVVVSAAMSAEGVGAQGYIKKPVDIDKLIDVVRSHCGAPEAR